MKFEFSNLGAIKHTELDLRPLTVIIGPNNSNKTYVASFVYGLITKIRLDAHSHMWDIYEDTASALPGAFRHTLDASPSTFSPSVFFQDLSQQLFYDTFFRVTISSSDPCAFSSPEDFLSLQYLSEEDRLQLASPGEATWETRGRLLPSLLREALHIFFPRPFFLPSERNALVTSYRMLSDRRYRYLRDQQRNLSAESPEKQLALTREQGGVRYPQPIEDFLDSLTDFELNQNFTQTPQFLAIDALIEKHLNHNHKVKYRPTATGGKELYLEMGKQKVDLYNASSSIKQLTPLLLYLRYRARENDLLIIDEPEMNLHPESQAKLLEILAILVNMNVKVLLTTHSPYIMAHLNNLMQSEEKPKAIRQKQAKSLYVKDTRAFLKPDQISAYEMTPYKEGRQTYYRLESLHDPDYGIRWGTLSSTAEDVQEKYFELYEKGKANTKTNGVSHETSAQTK